MRIHNLLGLAAAGVILSACGGGGNDENNNPSAIVVLSGNNQTGSAGAALAQPITVQVTDKQDDPVKGASVTFAVTAGGGNLQSTTVTTDASGQASTIWTVGTLVGAANTASASVSGVSAPATFNATVTAAAIATATVNSGDAQTAEVGAALAQAIVTEFKDAFNNPVANAPVVWTVTAGGGSLANVQATTDAQGHASANWTLGLELGAGHSVTATAGGITATANASATLGAGTTLSIASGDGQSALGGSALAAPLGVRVRTAASQGIAKVPVTWAVTAGGGNLSTTSSLTDNNGVATTSWTLGASGAQTVSASNASTTPTIVNLTATAVVVAPSTITGSISLSDQLVSSSTGRLSGFRAGSVSVKGNRAQRMEATFPSYGRVRRSQGGGRYVPGELIVVLKREAVNAPFGIRANASVATAQAVGQAMRERLSAHAMGDKVTVAGVSPVIRMARIKVADPAQLDSVGQALARDPAIEAVGLNAWAKADAGPVRPGVTPNDQFYAVQSWNYAMVDLPRTWATTTGSSNIIVAVLDNGAVFHHPSVGQTGATAATGGGNYRNDGFDFVSDVTATLCASQGGGTISNAADGNGYDSDPSTPDDRDPDGQGFPCARSQIGSHGTHVAGTIGAKGNDGVAVVGVNWTVGIRPVRVLGIDGGSYFDIAQGLLYASGFPADNGAGGVVNPPAQPARIVNMSLGGDCPQGVDPLLAAVQTVTNPGNANGGVLVVVSAGNAASNIAPCPAAYSEVLAVGAVGPSGRRASYSNFGSYVDVAAPGGDFPQPIVGSFGILSSTCDFRNFPTACTPNHAFYVGTSMAAPHVAGIAALLLANNPALTPADLRARLVNFAVPIDPADQLGSGIVNARNALTMTQAPTRAAFARAINSTTGAVVSSVAASGNSFTIPSLPDGNYIVMAGQDEGGDAQIGLPGRRLGAFGGVSSPTAVAVSSAAGAFTPITVGFPVEEEPNNTSGSPASLVLVDAAVQGALSDADVTDLYKVLIPTAGTYTFETTGLNGAFCGFALDLDTILSLLDGNEALLDSSVDADATNQNFCSKVTRSLTAGTVFVRIDRDVLGGGAPSNGRYILQVRSGP